MLPSVTSSREGEILAAAVGGRAAIAKSSTINEHKTMERSIMRLCKENGLLKKTPKYLYENAVEVKSCRKIWGL